MVHVDVLRSRPEQEGKKPISIEFGGGHRLVVHEGKFGVLGREGQPILRDARAAISFDKTTVGIDDLASVIKPTEDGKGVKIEIAGTESRPGMTTEIMTGEDGLRIRQEIINTTGKDITFERFTGLNSAEGIAGVDPRSMWASAMGWSIWEPPIEGIVADLPQTNQIAIRPHNSDEIYDIVTKTHEDSVPIPWAVALRDTESDQQVFMGYLPRKGRPKHIGVIEPREKGIEAWNDGEGVIIPAGESRASEELVVRFGMKAFEARKQFSKEFAERVGVRRIERVRPENGYDTWYDLFNTIEPQDVPGLIDATAGLRDVGLPHVEYFTLDDVHNPAKSETNNVPPGNPEMVENFLSAFRNEEAPYTFGDNVKGYAKYCEDRGLRPEIWMAPFIVSSRSPVFQEMMEDQNGKSTDMLLKNRNGELFVTHYHPEQDANFYALDLTNKAAQELLRSQLRFFTDNGIKGFKFDFVYPGAMQGMREDRTKTATEAYNIGLQIVQEEVTDKELKELWCGQPIYETAGDGAGRLAPDSEAIYGIQWDPLPHMMHLRRGKSLRNASANALLRVPEGDALYGGGVDFDPTPVALDDELPLSRLSLAEARTSIAVDRAMGARGRMAFGHDPRGEIRPIWIQRYRTALDSVGGVSMTLRVNKDGYPVASVRETPTGREVMATNWGPKPIDIALRSDEIGVPDGVKGDIIFPGEPVDTQNGEIVFLNVPSHGSQVLAIPA
jgi:hypothetical protein